MTFGKRLTLCMLCALPFTLAFAAFVDDHFEGGEAQFVADIGGLAIGVIALTVALKWDQHDE